MSLDEEIISKMTKVDTLWVCNDCPYKSRNKTHVVEHVESKHVLSHGGYECPVCEKVYKVRSSFRQHKCKTVVLNHPIFGPP